VLEALIKGQLQNCPSDAYIIVSQPQVNAADYAPHNCAPHLRRSLDLEDQGNGILKSSFKIADVVGELDVDRIQDYVRTKCGAETLNVDASTGLFDMVDDLQPRVVRVEFPPLSTVKSERIIKLAENDAFLSSIIDLLPSMKYTVLFSTTPVLDEDKPFLHATGAFDRQGGSSSPLRVQKREVSASKGDSSPGNDNLVDGPLFDRYQFFTPGIFMGLVVGLLLFSILYIGISAVSSLQVPYGAFDKGMGLAVQKKQQ